MFFGLMLFTKFYVSLLLTPECKSALLEAKIDRRNNYFSSVFAWILIDQADISWQALFKIMQNTIELWMGLNMGLGWTPQSWILSQALFVVLGLGLLKS